MRRSMAVRVATCLLALATPPSVAMAFAQAGGPTIVTQGAMPVSVVPGDYTLVSVVLDFPPGAGISEHTHGGPLIVRVLQGQATLHEEGMSMTYKVGDGWTEMPGHKHSAINDGSIDDQVSLVALLPKGAELTTLTDVGARTPLPPPTVISQAAFPLTLTAEDANLVSVVLDFPPGTGIPDHVHGGPLLADVLGGVITLHDHSAKQTYKRGDMWTEVPGHVHSAANEESSTARVLVGALLPKGAELQTLVNESPAGMPSTGGGTTSRVWWLLPVVALVLGLSLRTWSRRTTPAPEGEA